MAPHSDKPLLAIVGPTASGKSQLAITIAEALDGEIICADSRTIYKGMDLGTAKPSKEEQVAVKHHLLDVVEPGEKFTAYDFQHRAKEAISDIQKRGKLPILVGGTGLYIDSVILDYQFPLQLNEQEKERLENLDHRELLEYCIQNNINLPKNVKNKRHLILAITQKYASYSKKESPDSNTFVVGIATKKEKLHQRIIQRAEYIFSHGIVDEAKKLGEMYGWDNEAMTGNIYPLIHKYLEGELSLSQVKEKFITLDRRLAKRQMTWLRRHTFIEWLPLEDAKQFIINNAR